MSYSDIKSYIANQLSINKKFVKVDSNHTKQNFYNIRIFGVLIKQIQILNIEHDYEKVILLIKSNNDINHKLLKFKLEKFIEE